MTSFQSTTQSWFVLPCLFQFPVLIPRTTNRLLAEQIEKTHQSGPRYQKNTEMTSLHTLQSPPQTWGRLWCSFPIPVLIPKPEIDSRLMAVRKAHKHLLRDIRNYCNDFISELDPTMDPAPIFFSDSCLDTGNQTQVRRRMGQKDPSSFTSRYPNILRRLHFRGQSKLGPTSHVHSKFICWCLESRTVLLSHH